MKLFVFRCLCILLTVGGLSAQVSRYELGLRLRQFERHLAEVVEAPLRIAAFQELDRAVQAFFGLDTKSVAKAIAAADCALSGGKWSVAQQYANSLQWTLDARLLASGDDELEGKLSIAYAMDDEGDQPLDLSIVIESPWAASPSVIPLGELPQEIILPLAGAPAGDHFLKWSIVRGDQPLIVREQALSIADDLEKRLLRIDEAVDLHRRAEPATIESKTLTALSKMLKGMQRRRPAETVLPGVAILAEAEALSAWLAKPSAQPFYGAHRPGSFRLRVPVGKQTIAVRLLVPELTAAAPLVLALHGAGGSENLFFDGYGDGRVVALGADRGWMVVAPRLTFGSLDCAGLVDALAKRFPVDRERVLMVGHSMGAMQAVANAVRTPERYRGVAALGGGGRVAPSEALKALPFFVGVGTKDFARSGANALHRALDRADADSTLREFEGVEHLAIVQVALAEVFRFFDGVLAR